MDLVTYFITVGDWQHLYPSWRAGQTYFNVLAEIRPDLSEPIRGTDLDPFHRDARIPAFLAYVAENFNENV